MFPKKKIYQVSEIAFSLFFLLLRNTSQIVLEFDFKINFIPVLLILLQIRIRFEFRENEQANRDGSPKVISTTHSLVSPLVFFTNFTCFLLDN